MSDPLAAMARAQGTPARSRRPSVSAASSPAGTQQQRRPSVSRVTPRGAVAAGSKLDAMVQKHQAEKAALQAEVEVRSHVGFLHLRITPFPLCHSLSFLTRPEPEAHDRETQTPERESRSDRIQCAAE